MKSMSTSRLLSQFGASVFHTTKANLVSPPLQFPKLLAYTAVRFRRYCASAITHEYDAVTSDCIEPTVSVSKHPWPEWVSFIDRLKIKGYITESATVSQSSTVSFESESTSDGGGIIYTEMDMLKQACLNFARDRFDIFKSLSRQDIKIVVERGCPNLLRKAVNSSKRLRAYVQLAEEDACSVCNLRGSCDRAYVISNDSEAARTVDIVRLLLLYALDPLVISGMEKPPGRDLIEVSAKNLLSELVVLSETSPEPELPKPAARVPERKKKLLVDIMPDESSQNVEMKRGDWICTECNFMNFAKNLTCLRCGGYGPKGFHRGDVGRKQREWVCPRCSFMNFAKNIICRECKADGPNRDSGKIEMKKGDWNCLQCGFMNFARNLKCFSCQEPRPKRQLNPGEWDCPSCGFLNYRRNIVCKKCDHERPRELATSTQHEDEHVWTRPF